VNVIDTVDYIKQIYKKFSPDYPINYSFIDENIAQYYQSVKNTAKSVLYASWIAIFISLLGLTGLTMFMIELRTKEIGIRKVMGASANKIVMLLVSDFLKYILIANILAWPTAWYFMNRYLSDFAYKVNQNILIYLLSACLAIALSLLVVSALSFKIAHEKPSNSLKYE